MRIGLKIKGVDEAIWNCGRPLVEKAMRQALKTLGTGARTQISKLMRNEYNIKKKDLDKEIKVIPQLKNYQITLQIKGRKIPLIYFGAKETERGVRISIKKGKKVVIPHTFIAKGLPPQVFEREIKGGKRVPKLHIIKQVGPSIPQLVKGTKILDGVKEWAVPQAQKLFDSKLSYLSKKKS